MGARTITTRQFVCNNCGLARTFDNDGDAGKAGWALVNVNGKEYALCTEHYDELRKFLHVDTIAPRVRDYAPNPSRQL